LGLAIYFAIKVYTHVNSSIALTKRITVSLTIR
jgi:hypothetical protein